jgi:hypothetical protein
MTMIALPHILPRVNVCRRTLERAVQRGELVYIRIPGRHCSWTDAEELALWFASRGDHVSAASVRNVVRERYEQDMK